MKCQFVQGGDLDAYVTGELSPAEARSVEAHLFGCSQCAAELRRLRAEQRLFRARAEQDTAVVPSFEGVLARLGGAGAKGEGAAKGRAPATRGGAGAKGRAPATRGGVPARGATAGGAQPSVWTSFLAPAGVAVAALAAAAASWVGVRPSPVEVGPGARPGEVEEVEIGPDRVCTGEPPVSDEPTASEAPEVAGVKGGVTARVPEDWGVCGGGARVGEVCGGGEGSAAATMAEPCADTVAWCSDGRP